MKLATILIWFAIISGSIIIGLLLHYKSLIKECHSQGKEVYATKKGWTGFECSDVRKISYPVSDGRMIVTEGKLYTLNITEL